MGGEVLKQGPSTCAVTKVRPPAALAALRSRVEGTCLLFPQMRQRRPVCRPRLTASEDSLLIDDDVGKAGHGASSCQRRQPGVLQLARALGGGAHRGRHFRSGAFAYARRERCSSSRVAARLNSGSSPSIGVTQEEKNAGREERGRANSKRQRLVWNVRGRCKRTHFRRHLRYSHHPDDWAAHSPLAARL